MDSSVKALGRSLAVDAAIVALIFWLVTWATSLTVRAGTDVAVAMIAPGGVILIGFATGLYGGRLNTNAQLLGRGTLAIVLCLAIGALGAASVEMSEDVRLALLIGAPLSGVLMIAVRAARRSMSASEDRRRRLFIVAPEEAQRYIVKQCHGTATRFIPSGQLAPDQDGRLRPADIARLDDFVARADANCTIVISGGLLSEGCLADPLLRCIDAGGRVESVAAFLAENFGRLPNDDAESLQRLLISSARRRSISRVLERGIDIAVVIALLVLAAPVLAVVALAIWLQDGGPVLYRQTRIGLHGRPFTVLKFRSMRLDAEADGSARWAQQNDARVTPFGSFLRAHRLDELPQLFNVLRNEMSIVGPRPERPEMVETLRREIPLYDHRHRVRPGLTGWAQINFPYGASIEDAAEKTRYDLYYVQNRSPLLNLLILLQTMRVVIFAEGSR
jgi:exopolysaccharide biosynthesis polyprenyl glycosylphosphotransferase